MSGKPCEVLPTSTILVVEESIQSSDAISTCLQNAGAIIAGPVCSLEAALLVLITERVCAVVFASGLDRGEGAKKLSATLDARKIPSLMIDWSPLGPMAPRATDEQLAWPFSDAMLVAAVHRLVTGLPNAAAGLV